MNYFSSVIILFFSTVSAVYGQEGIAIGAESVNDSYTVFQVGRQAVDTGGVLLPSHTTSGISSISAPVNGLLMYNRSADRFAYSKAGSWRCVNPWNTNSIMASSYISTALPVSISATLTVNGTGSVSNTLTAEEFDGKGMVPIGGIITWSGEIAAIPSNYELCDGIQTTPDLSDRFIVAGEQPGTTGGTNQLTTTEIVYDSGTSSGNVVTSTDNRPACYVLAFIR